MFKMNKKGFTLVELMVVLAILGLLAAIGIPQYTQVMERARLGRDVAAIATLQTAVDAFNTETDWLEKATDSVEITALSTITAKSRLTGGNVTLQDFVDAGLPSLESKDFKTGSTWHISTNGVVYVQNGTGVNAKRLPDR